MNLIPNLHLIGTYVNSWQRGIMSADDAHQLIGRALEPDQLIPEAEAKPDAYASIATLPELVRIARLERRLDALLNHFGVIVPDPSAPESLAPEVRQLLDDPSQKVEAIKVHRALTNASLAEAKHAVEAYVGGPQPRT